MNTSEILNKAADLIEERGWVGVEDQARDASLDPWGRDGGPVCLEGAIVAAAGLAFNFEASECAAGLAVRNHLEEQPRHLFAFNDERGRTAAEVIEVLRATAVIEAAREDAEAPVEVPA